MKLPWRIGWDVLGRGGKTERTETLSSDERTSYRVDEFVLGGAAGVVPCTVLDPFGGTGTTAGAAIAHGRHAIVVEPSAEYRALIPDRVRDVVARETAAPRTRRARARDAGPASAQRALPGIEEDAA